MRALTEDAVQQAVANVVESLGDAASDPTELNKKVAKELSISLGEAKKYQALILAQFLELKELKAEQAGRSAADSNAEENIEQNDLETPEKDAGHVEKPKSSNG
jgi:hypothetical protein